MTATTIGRDGREATAATGMDVLAAIKTRRSIGKVHQEVPPREAIEEILEAAPWAPNHYVTEPWRFVVIAGDAREAIGEVMARSKVAGMDPSGKDLAAEYERAKAKALRAPVIIATAVEFGDHPKTIDVEEIAAGAAAVQNMLLAAHAPGLAAMWRTGDPACDPNVKAFLGFASSAHLLGFVFVECPATSCARARHTPAATLTRWLGWNDADA